MIGALGEADYYPAQLRELLDALAAYDALGETLPRKARGLLHLVTFPPPGSRVRLHREVHEGRTFMELLDAYLVRCGINLLGNFQK